MPKPQDIFQLARQEAVRVTASPQAWQSFLYTAAHNYHTTYLNQLLIHAQRPDAAACASMEYWNTKANRLVMRGSRCITVLQRRQGVAVTKPVFAIGDTTLLSQTHTGGPWEVTDTTRPLLLQDKSDDWLTALAQDGVSNDADRARRMLERNVADSTLQWAQPDEQMQLLQALVTQSAVYMARLRIGLPVQDEDYPAFQSVSQFDTCQISLCLGGYVQAAAEPMLNAIGREALRLSRDSIALSHELVHNESTRTQLNSREEAVTHDVHEEPRRLPDSEPFPAEPAEPLPEPLREAASGISGTERADTLRPTDAGGHAADELQSNRTDSTADGGQDPARADADHPDAGPQDEPAGLGTADQQPEEAGGGSSPSDAVRNLTESPAQAESEPSPSAFALPEFPPTLLPQLLAMETSSRASNAEYLTFYNKNPLLIDRLRFVRESYKDIFTELLLADDTRVGFHKQDTLVIGEDYWNEETLGKLTIRKTGEALTGKIETNDLIDPWMTGETDSDFAYTLRPLAGAEYTITAAEDIYTQDRQLDANGNRTLWYANGDVVAVVTTGDGSADTAVFAPSRTKATYDFLSVIHDGTIGEVSITLPLGSYHVEETKPPYGYVGTTDSYDVTFVWDNQLNDVVMAKSIIKNSDSEQHFDVVRASEASAELAEQQTLGFYNDREHARVGVYKINQETGNYLAGAVFNLYTRDDIYDVNGNKLFSAGDLISTSPETVADGYTYFNCDVPIRGEWYGQSDRLDASTNSGNYFIRELRAPQGYYFNDAEMDVTFTYDGEVLQVLDNTCANKPTEMWVSKRDLTNDEELPGATLIIKDAKGNIVDTWVSTDTPHRVTGLHFDEDYTLTEKRPADGYAVADDIVFRLERKADADGHELDEADVYYLKDKKKLWIIPWEEWELLDDATVIMRDDITKVQISKIDIATGKELPGAELVIKDKDGNTVAQWVSEDKPHYIEKLPAGEYTLTEITAPNGYQLAESIAFTVLPTGELQTVVMKDARIPEETPHEDSPSNTPQPTPGSTPAPTPAPASAPTATPAPMPVIPQTGDGFPFALLSAAVFGSIVGFGIFAYKRRKSKMDESEQ